MLRQTLIRRENVDTDRLYGSLPEAIKYLQEIEAQGVAKSLEEYWEGHENMYMAFCWEELENDVEYASRIDKEKYYMGLQRKWQNSKKRKAEGQKKLAALKKQYGL